MRALLGSLLRWETLRRRWWGGGLVAFGLLLLWWGGFFTQQRLSLNDTYYIAQPTTEDVVLVAIDNATLQAYGRSPVNWSRALYADLLRILQEGGARVAALDLLFAEPGEGDAELLAALEEIRNTPPPLRVIMPIVGGQRSLDAAPDGQIRYDNMLAPLPDYQAQVDYIGFVNAVVDPDSAIRRQMSLVQVADQLGADGEPTQYYSFPIATYLAYTRISPLLLDRLPNVMVSQEDALQVNERITLPVDDNGIWYPTYFGPASNPSLTSASTGQTFPTYSMQAVLNGEVPPSVFQDKAVLIGLMSSTGLADTYNVPTSRGARPMAGVEIMANSLESILQAQPLHPLSDTLLVLMILSVSITSWSAYALLRWYMMLPMGVAFCALGVGLAFILFDTQGVIIDLFYVILAVTAPLLGNILLEGRDEFNRRRQAEFLLASMLGVSRRQLSLSRLMPRFVEDVQRVYPATSGAVWLWEAETQALQLGYRWPETASRADQQPTLAEVALSERKSLQANGQAAIPMLWGEQHVGAIVLDLYGARLPRSAERLLTRISAQAAPLLANARLYTQAQRQNQLMSAVLTHSPGGILVLDDQQTIQRSNIKVDTDFGVEHDVYFGQSFRELLTVADVPAELQADISSKLAGEAPFQLDFTLGNKTLQLQGARLPDMGQAQRSVWVLLMNDITALSDLNKLKTHMLRMASHDLKNPLGTIMGYVEILSDDTYGGDMLSEQAKPMLARIGNAANDMHVLITDLLDLEQLRSGAYDEQDGLVHMGSLFDIVISRHTGQQQDKGQTLKIDLPEDDVLVRGNERQLVQALSNLVGNAIKYTPDGGDITVKMTATAERVHIQIIDTGYGIPKEAQARLFEQFYRVRTSETSHIKGTGLGLSLVKAAIEAHGGRVWAESEVGQGSTFQAELPRSYESESALESS